MSNSARAIRRHVSGPAPRLRYVTNPDGTKDAVQTVRFPNRFWRAVEDYLAERKRTKALQAKLAKKKPRGLTWGWLARKLRSAS